MLVMRVFGSAIKGAGPVVAGAVLALSTPVLANNEALLSNLRHVCIAQFLETGTFDRHHCDLDDVTNSRPILPPADAIKYCATARFLLMLGDQAAHSVDLVVCDPSFATTTKYANGTLALVNGELYWPTGQKLADARGNLWFSSGTAATNRDTIYYFRGPAAFKTANTYQYQSTVKFRVESNYYHPRGNLAVSSRGVLFYPNTRIAGGLDGGGVNIFYPEGAGARIDRKLYCSREPNVIRGNTSGNLLADACTLQRLCSSNVREDLCRRRDFYRDEPQLEALAAMKILADIR